MFTLENVAVPSASPVRVASRTSSDQSLQQLVFLGDVDWYPKSSILIGISIVKHPAIVVFGGFVIKGDTPNMNG